MLADRNNRITRWESYQGFLRQRELVLAPQTYRIVREMAENPTKVFYRTGSAESSFRPNDLDFYALQGKEVEEFISSLGFKKVTYGPYFSQVISVEVWEISQYSRNISSIIDKIHIQLYPVTSFAKKQEVMRQYYQAQRFLRGNKACHKAFQRELLKSV